MKFETTEQVVKYIKDTFPVLEENLNRELQCFNSLHHRWVLGDIDDFEIRITRGIGYHDSEVIFSKSTDDPPTVMSDVASFLEGYICGFELAKKMALKEFDKLIKNNVKVSG